MKRTTVTVAILLSALAPAPLLAHPFHFGDGLTAGLVHPFGGADHLLALVAVGLLAARYVGRRGLAMPAAFVAGTTAGFAVGIVGLGPAVPEAGILATVVATGALVAAPGLASPGLAAWVIGLFGVLHGMVHALEVPGAGAATGAGLVVATAALHLAGLSAGIGLRRVRKAPWIRALGAAVVTAALALPLLG